MYQEKSVLPQAVNTQICKEFVELLFQLRVSIPLFLIYPWNNSNLSFCFWNIGNCGAFWVWREKNTGFWRSSVKYVNYSQFCIKFLVWMTNPRTRGFINELNTLEIMASPCVSGLRVFRAGLTVQPLMLSWYCFKGEKIFNFFHRMVLFELM